MFQLLIFNNKTYNNTLLTGNLNILGIDGER